jgi:hypothetical protein
VVDASDDLRGTSAGEQHISFGVGVMSVFVGSSHLALLVAMSGMAAISGLVLTKSIEEEDVGSAKVWGTVFGTASVGAAWTFGRML